MMRSLLWTVALVLILASGGCRSVTSPVTYYTLNGNFKAAGETDDSGNGRLTIGIRPVVLPGYVNRLQMVTRAGANQLIVSGIHRWADYPDRLVQKNLAENLQWLIPQARVIAAPWPVDVQPDAILAFQFYELLGTDAGEVMLSAVWTVSSRTRDIPVQSHREAMVVPITGSGFDGLAEAHNRALERLSRKVAGVLRDSGVLG